MAADAAKDLRRKRNASYFRRSAMRHGRDGSQLVLRTFQRFARSAGVRKEGAGVRRDGRSAPRRSEGQCVSLVEPIEFNLGRKFYRYGALDSLSAHYRERTSGRERHEGGHILPGSTPRFATRGAGNFRSAWPRTVPRLRSSRSQNARGILERLFRSWRAHAPFRREFDPFPPPARYHGGSYR